MDEGVDKRYTDICRDEYVFEMELSQARCPRPKSVCVAGEAGEEGYFLMLIYHEANPPLRSAGGRVDSSISWYCNINAHPEDNGVVCCIHDLLHTPLTHTYACA